MKISITPKQAKEMLWLMESVPWKLYYTSMKNPEIDYALNLRKDSVLKVIAKFKKLVRKIQGEE